MDEGAFVPEDLFVVFQPLLLIDGSWMFIASSPPEDPSHWFHQLRQSKAPDYRDVSFEQVCSTCLAKPQAEWQFCTHVTTKVSLLKDKNKQDQLVNQLNVNKEKLMRETSGVTIQENTCLFHERTVKALMDPKRRTFGMELVDMLMFSIDPSYMGSNFTAFSVIARIQGFYTIVWIDIRSTVRDLMKTCMDNIAAFHNKVRKNSNIPIIIAIEAISRIDGQQLAKSLAASTRSEYDNIRVMTDESNQKGHGLEGVRLNRDRKIAMATRFEALMDEGNVRLWEDFETDHPQGKQYILNELESELRGFRGLRYSKKLNDSTSSSSSKELTGKRGLRNDDIILVLIMCTFYWKRFRFGYEYAHQREGLQLVYAA